MDVFDIVKTAQNIQNEEINIEKLKELFGNNSNIKNNLTYQQELEYIKRKIITQFSIEIIGLVNGISQYDTLQLGEENAYKEFSEIRDNVYEKINDTDQLLKFDSKALQFLFGNDLQIYSKNDVDIFKDILYKKNTNQKHLTLEEIYNEEDFKQNYEKSKNLILKIRGFYKYKKLTNKKQIENRQIQMIRQMINKKIKESKEKINKGKIITEIRLYIDKGIAQYYSNNELLSISLGVITSLTKNNEKIDIKEEAKLIRQAMNKIKTKKMDIKYRDNNNIRMGDENFHEEVFQPINFEEINTKLDELQLEYEELYNNKDISNEDYLKGVAKIYADIIYIQPYTDGNKRTAMGILNAMILSKNIIPPIITTVQENKLTQGIKNTRNNEYELLGNAIVEEYKKLNKKTHTEFLKKEEKTFIQE